MRAGVGISAAIHGLTTPEHEKRSARGLDERRAASRGGVLAGFSFAPHVSSVISYVFVDGFTRVARDEAIERLKRAIAIADGVIVDFAFFGWEAIRLTVELDVAALEVLRRELTGAGVELFARSAADLDGAKGMGASHPVVAMLHIAFVPAELERGVGGAHLP